MKKREALEICIKMWEYLAQHPDSIKRSAIYNLGLPNSMSADCAACEYNAQFTSYNGCLRCPVWTGKHNCMTHPTINFWVWDDLDLASSERTYEAGKIARLAKRRLKELDAREKKTGRTEE